ncbi:12948_t:CDS:1, partial [Funneliformis geosporum]
ILDSKIKILQDSKVKQSAALIQQNIADILSNLTTLISTSDTLIKKYFLQYTSINLLG